jgi:pimeloyl-ACP methyl ester carboxylesterase
VLHGGAVASRFFDKNIRSLAEHLRVIAVDLWGHGRSPDREGRFTLESFSADVAEIIEGVAGGPADVLGHSIGAAVGLDLVLRRTDLVQKLIQASGGFDVKAEPQPGLDIDRMVEQTVAFLGTTYGEVSPDGEAHFATVVRKDFELTSREPVYSKAQLGRIQQRTLVMVADDDISSLEQCDPVLSRAPEWRAGRGPGHIAFPVAGEARAL